MRFVDALGEESKEQAEAGPQHELAAQRGHSEAPQHRGREVRGHLVDPGKQRGGRTDNHEEDGHRDERRIPGPPAPHRRPAPQRCRDRRPMVSASPTAGGFAGYFRNGTRNTVTNPTAASVADVARAPARITRPWTRANSRAKMPPRAAP